MKLLSEWLSSNGFMPHGFCYQWKPALVWLNVFSDSLIALAYFCIPVALVHFVRKRRDVPFSWMFICLGIFIAACGMTHVMDVWTLWVPSYWFSGGVKVITALASIPTAVALVRFVPQAISLPTHADLEAANEELRRQDDNLKRIEERFRQMADNIQEIFWMMDPQSKAATYVSPAFEQICELPVESLYSNPRAYRELIHPEDRQRVLAGLDRLQATSQFEEEFRINCPSGKVKWLRAIGFNAKDSSGAVRSLVGTVQEITTRKAMEITLRESEDLFRDLVEHSTDLICTHTLEGRLLSVNELPAKLLGYSREELLNKPMRELLLPEARAQFDQSLLNIQRDGFVKGSMVVLTKSGERRIWEYHNTLRTTGVSTPIVRGIAHDITEQKRMERALRLSEEKFSKAFRASPHAILITTKTEGRLIDVNDNFFRIMGFTRDETIGRTSFELGLWTSSNDREDMLRELSESGRVKSKEITLQTRAGRNLAVSYSAEMIELGGSKCVLSVWEDITERKRAEARLREYEKALEGVEEMIAVLDREHRYLLANQSFLHFGNSKREEVVGHLVSELKEGKFIGQVVKERLDEAFEGKIVKCEAQYKDPETGQRDIFISYLPLEGTTGIDRVVCVMQDITERKLAERELRRLSGQLLRLQDQERRKIARDLHDTTGQDLVALAATLSQLHDSIPTANRKWRNLVSQCQVVAARSLREVRTLSYLLHPPILDEAGLEDAVRHFTDGFGKRTGIEMEVEVSPMFGRLPEGIELGLFRVIQESLVNIQRHSGSFTAKIVLSRDAENIVLEVSDTGRGISASHRKKNGTVPLAVGVGIPSMEERVEQLGGQLSIDSSSRGTTVSVTVPLDDQGK